MLNSGGMVKAHGEGEVNALVLAAKHGDDGKNKC